MSGVKLTWEENLIFKTEQDGHSYYLDVSKEAGGSDKGIRPKAMLLTALAGCSGMDVVSLLKKMRVADFGLEIEVKAEVAEEHPKVYTAIELIFRFSGNDIPADKAKRTVELTTTKYCPVFIMLEKATEIITKIYINDKEIDR